MPITDGLEVTVRNGEKGEPVISVSYRTRVTHHIVEARRMVLQLTVRHHPVAALLSTTTPNEFLDEFAQSCFDCGRRFERIELQKLAEKERRRRTRKRIGRP